MTSDGIGHFVVSMTLGSLVLLSLLSFLGQYVRNNIAVHDLRVRVFQLRSERLAQLKAINSLQQVAKAPPTAPVLQVNGHRDPTTLATPLSQGG